MGRKRFTLADALDVGLTIFAGGGIAIIVALALFGMWAILTGVH